jgi:hypothetical protein
MTQRWIAVSATTMEKTNSLFSTDIGGSEDASAVFGQSPGLLVAIPGRGWAPYLIVPGLRVSFSLHSLLLACGLELKFNINSHHFF